jgi:hypothetical protein
MEEGDLQFVEKWGINSGYEVLQVFADSSEIEISQSWQGRACLHRRAFLFLDGSRLRGFEF